MALPLSFDPSAAIAMQTMAMPTEALVVPREMSSRKRKALDEESSMMMAWDQTMCETMKIPDGYENITVLILKWADEIDGSKTREEVEKLRSLFEKSFKYETKIVDIHSNKSPQVQLNHAICDFILKHDGPNNLLIVYYTGHASFHDEKSMLELSATNGNADFVGAHTARASWELAEKPILDNVQGDCLAILDTCFAGTVHKNVLQNEPRTYELLSASGPDRTTIGPGPKSFTSALILALDELCKEHKGGAFTTWQLEQKITMQDSRRHNPPRLCPRLRNYDRHIKLAPLQKKLKERRKLQKQPEHQQPHQQAYPAHITLRLAINAEGLSVDRIKKLAKTISLSSRKAEVGVQRIDWLGIRSPDYHPNLREVTHLIVAVNKFQQRRTGTSPRPDGAPQPTSSSGEKRKRDSDEEIISPVDTDQGFQPPQKRNRATSSVEGHPPTPNSGTEGESGP